MSLKTIRTTRGNIAIQYKRFNYRKDRTLVNGDISWRCVSLKCLATLKTNNDVKVVKSTSGSHSHPPPSASASPASPATPSPQEPDKDVASQSTPPPSSPNMSTPPPSMTDLLSPYTNITPALPKYNCVEEENAFLRKRVTDLEYMNIALTDKAIELEKRLIASPNPTPISHETSHPQPQTSHPAPQPTLDLQKYNEELSRLEKEIQILKKPCEKCKLYSVEAKNMIQSIRILEEEINTLKQTSPIHIAHAPQCSLPSPSIIPLSNQYHILSTIPDSDVHSNFVPVIYKKNKKKGTKTVSDKKNVYKKLIIKKAIVTKKHIPFRHVTVVGDSHCRGLAALMTSGTTGHTTITGVCKPGAGLLDIAPATTPPDDHAYVIIAGTNDVAAGKEAMILQHMERIIKQIRRSSRVLVSPLPPRHDLPADSPVHTSVALMNNYISEICDRLEGVEMVDLSELGREHFTRHGLHLNPAGKRIMAGLLVAGLAEPSLSRDHRRPVKRPVVALQRSSPSCPTTMQHDSYSDAVVNGPSTPPARPASPNQLSTQPSQPTKPPAQTTPPLTPSQQQTIINPTEIPYFLGTPLANIGQNHTTPTNETEIQNLTTPRRSDCFTKMPNSQQTN